jgi:hypothetical protein
MAIRHVFLHRLDAVKMVEDVYGSFKDINEYIKYVEALGIRPYKKDIKETFLGAGIGEPKMNHVCTKEKKYKGNYEYFKYYIINKKQWIITRLKYGI